MPLRARRFRYDRVLNECLAGTRRLKLPDVPGEPFETGRYIRKVQQALQDQGFPLPQFGADSMYGPETADAVSRFKTREGIDPSDGVVGMKTMQRLDDLFVGEPDPAFALTVGEMNVDDFLEAVQAAESANASDSPEEFLTRIRQLYYPGTDPIGLTFREVAFDQLMPSSPVRQAGGSRRVLGPGGMDGLMFLRLAQRAYENAAPPLPPDNPSPYLVDATGTRVDIGHFLLTMEAVFHPTAGSPYSTFGIPAIDPASFVADLGSAAVWAEQNGVPDAPRTLPPDATGNPDFPGYFAMSAPDPDLVGDIDGFNIASQWQSTGGSLSVPLVAYYLDGEVDPGGYRRRFRDFVNDQIGDPDDPASWRSDRARLEKRINRFNDLFAAGATSAFLTLTPPPPRSWRFTPDALDAFYDWLDLGVAAEKDTFD
jgi:hypothetical protein